MSPLSNDAWATSVALGLCVSIAAGVVIVGFGKECWRDTWDTFTRCMIGAFIACLFAWWWMPWLFYILANAPWPSLPIAPHRPTAAQEMNPTPE